ncbi:MAG TPA: hypothetical protein PK405_09895 [Hyphomicrobiales bacterium]|nr:hypothetical protein [Rhodobiaceae bacterium]HXK54987.1 hypothetical protein [Hyphomicrobiales bacterium]
MRALGLTDTIFFNLGHRYITSIVVLEKPCDADRVLAGLQAVADAYPPLRERFVHVWPFFAAFPDRNFALENHVCTLIDPSVRDIETLVPVIEKARRTITSPSHSPWRVFILNPSPMDGQPDGDAGHPLSVVMFQFKHGLADAARSFQVLAAMGSDSAPPAPVCARDLPRLTRREFMALAESGSIDDGGLSVLQIGRRNLRRDQDPNGRLVHAAAGAIADPSLFSHESPLNGRIARTRLVRRRAGRRALGNHLETVAEAVAVGDEKPAQRRWRIPGLERAQSLPIARYVVAISPPPLARLLMRRWYSRFDAMVTMLPVPPKLSVGGAAVAGVFGVPPLSGRIPLMLVATACGDTHNLVIIPGTCFTGERASLHRRLHELLTRKGKAADKKAKPAGAAAPGAARRPAQAGTTA